MTNGNEPDGQITSSTGLGRVESRSQKYFALPVGQIISTSLRRPVPLEGRFAIVTNAGRDAVDADAPITNGAEADGEVVWS